MDNNRQIAKQLFDKHFMFKDNPIAWTAWKMAFQMGIEHQRALMQADVRCSAFSEGEIVDTVYYNGEPVTVKLIYFDTEADSWLVEHGAYGKFYRSESFLKPTKHCT